MAQLGCDEIAGQVFRPLFGQALTAERLEDYVNQAFGLAPGSVGRRLGRDVLSLDWQKDEVWYTVGLQGETLVFANIRFTPGRLAVRQALACLGAPQWYQAWYEAYPVIGNSSVQLALVFPARSCILYGSQYYTSASEQAPALDDSLPVSMVSIFGKQWQDDERVLGKSEPWPGDWRQLQIEVHVHRDLPVESDRDQALDALPATAIPDVLAEIAAAFGDAPRPADDELLHPDARDENEIQALLGVPHWRELPDAAAEGEWSALAFLGPAGFRHFLPAYMSWVLRHPDSGAAVVSSTIFALTPAAADPLRAFTLSKFSLFDDAQRAAVVSFLRAMANFEDVAAALDHWLPRGGA